MLDATLKDVHALASGHYENFPVAPWFLPKGLREPIAIIYAFARSADDIADEGDASPIERQAALDVYRHQLDCIQSGQKDQLSPLFLLLDTIIQKHQLPIIYFYDLLSAFRQDTQQHAYETEAMLLDYCRRSANPVGRLLLYLTQPQNHPGFEAQLLASDKICTALQLINFCQDLGTDLKDRDRLYIPLADLAQFHNSKASLFNQVQNADIDRLVQHQWQRACDLLIDGSKLTQTLSGRFKFGISLTVAGGAAMLRALSTRSNPYERITLSRLHWCQLLTLCLINKPLKGLV